MAKKLTKEELSKAILDKQFENSPYTFETAKSDPEWFINHRVTKEQNQAWIDWSIDILRKNGFSKKNATREMLWFNLMFGFAIENEHDKHDSA